jgi:acyl phosphate:glycerol-3-phosphate acyltransferase
MEILFLLATFLLGSFPTGVVVARAKGVDLRKVGSGNIGTTNVGRALGRRWAAFVLLVDAGKGALPVLLAMHFFHSPWLTAGAGFVAVLGQVFSVFLKGRGGKGVATSLGAGLALAPWPALGPAAVWIVLLLAFRISSIGSMAAVVSFPLFLWLWGDASTPKLCFAAAVAVLVVARHKENLQRLIRGQELRAERMPERVPDRN